MPSLPAFVEQVETGSGEVRGLYVQGVMAAAVVDQPAGRPGYVSLRPDAVTRFALASQYGSLGLLAHNTLAGERFFELRLGQPLVVVRGDGRLERYRVTALRRFRALQPNSPYSTFEDLDAPGHLWTATELFYEIYAHEGRLVLQTCIAADGIDTWGRLFVIAVPDRPLLTAAQAMEHGIR